MKLPIIQNTSSERTIAAFAARRSFGKILQDVAIKDNKFIVERHGEAIAAVVPIAIYRQWKRRREAFFSRMEQIAQRANLSEAEADKLADEAVHAVRSQK